MQAPRVSFRVGPVWNIPVEFSDENESNATAAMMITIAATPEMAT